MWDKDNIQILNSYEEVVRNNWFNENGNENTMNIINFSKTNNSNSIQIGKDNNLLISPIKKEINNISINKIDNKQIHIKGRKNHNYISIINITNNAPMQKKEENNNDIYNDHIIYTKKIRGNFNTNKFLEENILNDINKDEYENKKNTNEIICEIKIIYKY